MAKYAGKDAVVYLSTSGAGAATTILGLNQWTLNMTTTKHDVTEFGDSNMVKVQDVPDVTGTLSGWWNDTDDNLYDASQSSDGCNMYLYPSDLVTGKYFYGPAWIDFSIDSPRGGPVTVSGGFEARGAWGME